MKQKMKYAVKKAACFPMPRIRNRRGRMIVQTHRLLPSAPTLCVCSVLPPGGMPVTGNCMKERAQNSVRCKAVLREHHSAGTTFPLSDRVSMRCVREDVR